MAQICKKSFRAIWDIPSFAADLAFSSRQGTLDLACADSPSSWSRCDSMQVSVATWGPCVRKCAAGMGCKYCHLPHHRKAKLPQVGRHVCESIEVAHKAALVRLPQQYMEKTGTWVVPRIWWFGLW